MQEMRFNPPPRPERSSEAPVSSASQSQSVQSSLQARPISKLILKALVWVVIAFLLIGGFWAMQAAKGQNGGSTASTAATALAVEPNKYSAVFLTNGQAYFGKIAALNAEEVVMQDVFYLQSSSSSGTASSTAKAAAEGSVGGFNLVRLGSEMHGPESAIHITRSNVLFYENLRDDSQLVTVIKNYKN